MRKSLFLAALALPLAATPALARDGQSYIEIDAGATFPITHKVVFTPPTGPVQTFSPGIDYNTGYDVGGAVGYDFGMIRAEGEIAYKHASIHDFNNS